MENLTEQRERTIRKVCYNDWRPDLEYFMYHKEKTMVKRIILNKKSYLECRLGYNSQNQIILHISKCNQLDNGFKTIRRRGKHIILDKTPVERKEYDNLHQATKRLTTDILLEINKNTPINSLWTNDTK